MTLEGDIKPKGGANPGRAARRGGDSGLVGGARPRGRANRGGRAENGDWQRFLGQAKSERAAARTGLSRKRQRRPGFRWGSILGGFVVARQQSPASSEAGAPETIHWPFVRARKRQGWRAMVAVEDRATGRSIPIRDAMQSPPCFGRDRWQEGKPRSTGCASGRSGREPHPRGDEACASGRDPWLGVRTRADPERLHGRATARGQKGRGDAEPAAGEDELRREIRTAGTVLVHPEGATSNRRAGGERPENAVNPRVGSGMQQAHGRLHGGTRRGGARPRGRNETSWRGCHGAEGRREPSGSGRADGMSTEGRSESQERRRGSSCAGAECREPRRGDERRMARAAGSSEHVGGCSQVSSRSGPKGQRMGRAGREGQTSDPWR